MKLLVRNHRPHSFVADDYTPTDREFTIPALPRLAISDYNPQLIENQLPARDAAMFRVKRSAAEMIEATSWRIERARERAQLGVEGETEVEVFREREAIRRASNRSEEYINNAEDESELRNFMFYVLPSDWPVE